MKWFVVGFIFYILYLIVKMVLGLGNNNNCKQSSDNDGIWRW